MEKTFNKWVAMWGNAVSINENKPEAYGKNITIRYELHCPFDGNKIRLTFDNYCGTEDISIEKTVASINSNKAAVTFAGGKSVTVCAGKNIVSDEIAIDVKKGDALKISFYLKDCTQMRSAVYVQGPLSKGKYAVGDHTEDEDFDINISRKTNIVYFLTNVSILTEQQNKAVVCYGDSITAQDWPDMLQQILEENNVSNISVVRRATSGSRILREYSCITYESYGLKGSKRFEHEVPTDGAETVIIQQGINDIIHPVGTDVNPFRPMSDLPAAEELIGGIDYYIGCGKKLGYKVVLGSLLPIEGWRTYAPFREELKNKFNELLKADSNSDGFIDFAGSVCDANNPKAFAPENDSGDHLHPSSAGYRKMAQAAFEYLSKHN